jgi:hypothetical protein
MQTANNTFNQDKDHQREYAAKISAVLPKLKTKDVLQQMTEKGVKKYTLDLLNQNPANDDLNIIAVEKDITILSEIKNITPAVAKAALNQSAMVFQYIPEALKQDKTVAASIITAKIKD